MKLKINKVFLLTAFLIFVIIYPYTRVVKLFRADDLNWDIIHTAKTYKKFDRSSFSFIKTYELSKEIIEIDGSQIFVKGFVYRLNHDKVTEIILTETVTDVCFMCNHDEHYNIIDLNSFEDNSQIKNLKDGSFVMLKGTFNINRTEKNLPPFYMENVIIEEIITKS